jgi:spore germination protein KB
MNFIHGVHVILSIPILEIVGILMVLPYASDNRKVARPVLLGLAISVFEMLVVTLRDAAVLGPFLPIMTSAPFTVTRLVDIANILTRLDILFAIPLLITAFVRLSVFYYGAVLGIAQIFKLRSYVPLVIPVGAFSIAISSNLFESDMQQSYAGMNIWPFNAMLYQLVIPVLMFIVILVRRLPKKRKHKEEKYKYIRKKSIDLMDDPE